MKNTGFIIFTAVLLIVIGCRVDSRQANRYRAPEQETVRIVTTTNIIADVVRNIGGKEVTVVSLMGPGVDPHLYKAREGDIRRMSTANIIFYNGLHLEGKMVDVLEGMRRFTRTVPIGEAIPDSLLIFPEQFEGNPDPHVWFDVHMWKYAVRRIARELQDYDTLHAAYYEQNVQQYLAALDSLDRYIRRRAAELPPERRIIITAHDAFNYFGRAYGFQIYGLQGISTASEAGARDVIRLARLIVTHRIPAIFVETSVSPRNIEALKAAVEAQGFAVRIGGSLYSDSLGEPGTLEGTYIGMVRHNIDTIVESLKQTPVTENRTGAHQ